MSPPRRRDPEAGSAILVTLILIAALLSGAAVLINVQLNSTRSADLARTAGSALYCAEAGLATARSTVANNYSRWNAAFGQDEPSWLTDLDHDLDDDGSADFAITLRDNDDELGPLEADVASDNDLSLFIVSTCVKYPEVVTQVSELVKVTPTNPGYPNQLGGAVGYGNKD